MGQKFCSILSWHGKQQQQQQQHRRSTSTKNFSTPLILFGTDMFESCYLAKSMSARASHCARKSHSITLNEFSQNLLLFKIYQLVTLKSGLNGNSNSTASAVNEK